MVFREAERGWKEQMVALYLPQTLLVCNMKKKVYKEIERERGFFAIEPNWNVWTTNNNSNTKTRHRENSSECRNITQKYEYIDDARYEEGAKKKHGTSLLCEEYACVIESWRIVRG